MTTRSATVDMRVNGDSTQESVLCARVPFKKICDHCSMGFRRKFHKNPPSANSICFLGFSRHFAVVSTVALLVAIVGVTSLIPHATKIF
jgi:hypothetical protein